MKSLSIIFCFVMLFAFISPLFSCDDYYLQWSTLKEFPAEKAENGFLAISDAALRLRNHLFSARVFKWNGPKKMVLGFVGWGENEKRATPEQIEDIKSALSEIFHDGRLDFNNLKEVDKPDYDKLGSILPKESNDFALSVIVKKYDFQWKSFLTNDLCSFFKLRSLLSERAVVEFKLVDSAGKLVAFETFDVSPTLLSDMNIENSGMVKLKSERYSNKPVMTIKEGELPPISTSEKK
jgi:hypothetical protein